MTKLFSWVMDGETASTQCDVSETSSVFMFPCGLILQSNVPII